MKLIIFTLVCLAAFSGNAYAYLDPGTGSVILQALAAALVMAAGAWYVFKTKIKSIFTRKKLKEDKKKTEEDR